MYNALFWAVHRVGNTKKRKATKLGCEFFERKCKHAWLHRHGCLTNLDVHKQHPRLQQIKCQFCDKLIDHFNWVWIGNAQLLLKHDTNLHSFNHHIF